MSRTTGDARALIYAPGLDNARVITRRLTGARIACVVCDDALRFEADLFDERTSVGVIVITATAVRAGGGAVVSRFKACEPAWSTLPIVLLAPPGELTVLPWPHTTLLTTPTTKELLVAVVERSLAARAQQRLMESTTDDLRHAAFHDGLTGLPNRSALYNRLSSLQRDRRGSHGAFSAVFVDVNDFKRINDEFGHATGDEVLRLVAAHLVATVRGSDVVARWGGDEFMILLDGPDGTQLVTETIERLTQPFVVTLQTVRESLAVSFSVGHVEGISADMSPDQIVALADQRMYEHKERMRNGDNDPAQ